MENLPVNIQESINRFVQECSKLLGKRLKKIILYGSYARGDYNNSSDIDILVLTDYKQSQFYSVLKKLSSMTYDITNYNSEIDTIPFYSNIQKEGVVLSE